MNWNNWRAVQAEAQGGGEGSETAAGAMDSGDLRQRIDNMIMETLKRHVSVSGQERVQELKEIAVTFEEKIYSTATSQHDYLQKISS
uniref:Transcription cofactor n=1 Tax=Solanum tuberosum TaxID=4113 RepID=M1APV5_SOLTU